MKAQIKLLLASAACSAAFTSSVFAQLSIPSDGSDGALIISNNTVIDLRLAVTGNWTNDNSANAGKGIYDPEKWAVVFKYSSVVISNGATVTFTNHPTHAPVVWLVSSNVTINGVVSLDGTYWTDPLRLPEPGPGGFRGGAIAVAGGATGSGFGPGGGTFQEAGSFATFDSYGNPQLVPLIGGSGGSGWVVNRNGGGGGGAILIAAADSITVNGTLSANGGGTDGYHGSGGGIRLVANQILGSGSVTASGQRPGRIQFEANTVSPSLGLNPTTTAVAPEPLVIWPATNAPTVKVVSVATLPAPTDPKASMTTGHDVTIAQTDAVAIVLETANFPTNGTVNVYLKPRHGTQSILPATFVSGSTNQALWQLTTALSLNHTIIQVRAVSN